MCPEQKQAQDLIAFIGKDQACDHCMFVLSEEFGLKKKTLRKFWEDVLWWCIAGGV